MKIPIACFFLSVAFVIYSINSFKALAADTLVGDSIELT